MKKKPKTKRRNQSQLAAELHLSRGTIVKYLSMAGAPKRDAKGGYVLKEVADWITEKGSGNIEGSELSTLRILKLKLDTQDQEFELSRKRGEIITKKEIAPTIAAAFGELTINLRQKFEFELPAKYKGRGTVECQAMNAAAIDFVIGRLREGTWALSNDYGKASA